MLIPVVSYVPHVQQLVLRFRLRAVNLRDGGLQSSAALLIKGKKLLPSCRALSRLRLLLLAQKRVVLTRQEVVIPLISSLFYFWNVLQCLIFFVFVLGSRCGK